MPTECNLNVYCVLLLLFFSFGVDEYLQSFFLSSIFRLLPLIIRELTGRRGNCVEKLETPFKEVEELKEKRRITYTQRQKRKS